jgi:hypothetical protein
MINVAYAAPYVPVIPALLKRWRGVRHTWTGWDGSVWEISDPTTGVALAAEGLEGLGMPEITNYTHDSPVVHGVEWDGWLATGRKVYWNIVIYTGAATDDTPSTDAWVERHRAFWKTLRPGKTGVWTVEIPSRGEKFSLTLRLGSPDSYVYDRDPGRRGWMAYGIPLLPEQPLWEDEPVIKVWETGEQVDFFGPTGYGPDFFISPSSNLASAVVTNRGDVESYAKWTVFGPTKTVEVGVAGVVTPIDFPIPEGSKLILNSDPLDLIAELDGDDVMDKLPDFGPPPIPPGEDVKLSLAMDGNGKVQVEFTPLRLMGV